jgi:hypothetical protein
VPKKEAQHPHLVEAGGIEMNTHDGLAAYFMAMNRIMSQMRLIPAAPSAP